MWFTVNTKPRNEDLACKSIELRGFEVYSPKIDKSRRRGGNRYNIKEPLFPGYIFIKSDHESDFVFKIQWSPGVKKVLCVGLTPLIVPDDAINLIKWRIGEEGINAPRLDRSFLTGSKVIVRFGPFQGLIGIIDRNIPGRERVRLFLDFMNRNTPVEMDTALVDPIE